MARYARDFMGIEGDPRDVRGMDPNHRGGYRGMRTHGDDGRAAYGWHRWTHREDFQGSGGYRGNPDVWTRQGYGGDFHRPRGGYDREWSGGGSRDPRQTRGFQGDRPVARFGGDPGRPRYGDDFRRRNAGDQGPGHFQGERFDYANRGLSSGGYSEGWAWGPMRGAR